MTGAPRKVIVPLKVVGKSIGVVGGGRSLGRRLRYHWLDGQLSEVATPPTWAQLAWKSATLVARQRLHSYNTINVELYHK